MEPKQLTKHSPYSIFICNEDAQDVLKDLKSKYSKRPFVRNDMNETYTRAAELEVIDYIERHIKNATKRREENA